MTDEVLVHVVDDDQAVRDSVALFLEVTGYRTSCHATGADFLDHADLAEPCVVLLDIQMPKLNGIDVLHKLARRGFPFPVIVMTGHGDIAMAVQTMKAGAFDFIEKPYPNEVLLSVVQQAADSLETINAEQQKIRDARAKVARLSRREREVLQGLLAALPNKLIGYELGISARTVELYRANLMEKLEVRGLSMAVRLGLLAGVEPLHSGGLSTH